MSKITFRADDDLVERLETFDASKSEVMRDALREYLDREEGSSDGAVDTALAERVDELIAERLDARLGARREHPTGTQPTDVNVNVTLDGVEARNSDVSADAEPDRNPARTEDPAPRKTQEERTGAGAQTPRNTCGSCGEEMADEDVYCPNCGEKTSHRVFCECGDEIRSDWSFCPGCGRRTPAADVLDSP